MIHFLDHMLTDDPSDLYQKLVKLYANIRRFDASNDVIAVCCVKEPLRTETLVDNIEKGILEFLCNYNLSTNNIWLITNNTIGNTTQIEQLLPRVSYFDYFACWCYHRHNIYQHPTNTQWNSESGKALFLMGKPYKTHRVGLLYHLSQLPCFDKLVYSFDPGIGTATEQLAEVCFSALCKNTAYRDFANKYQRTLDLNKVPVIGAYGIYHYTGFPYDADMYKNISISIVSETHFNGSDNSPGQHWITEKTWHAVLNCVPFVLVDAGNQHQYLTELGIRTYESYYKFSVEQLREAYNTHGAAMAVQMCAENICNFLSSYSIHQQEIAQNVQHNYDIVEAYYYQTLADAFNNDTDLYHRFFDSCAQGNL